MCIYTYLHNSVLNYETDSFNLKAQGLLQKLIKWLSVNKSLQNE